MTDIDPPKKKKKFRESQLKSYSLKPVQHKLY